MSTIDNAEMHQVQAQPENTSVKVSSIIISKPTSYADAIAEAISIANPDLEAILPLQRKMRLKDFKLNLNLDDNRVVKIFPAKPDQNLLHLGRISKSSSEGATITGKNVKAVFGEDVFMLPNRSQVEIIMANGKSLYGYTLISKTKTVLYLPKMNLPEEIELPGLGYTLPVKVIRLLVG